MYITQHKYSIERLPEATIGGGRQNFSTCLACLILGTAVFVLIPSFYVMQLQDSDVRDALFREGFHVMLMLGVVKSSLATTNIGRACLVSVASVEHPPPKKGKSRRGKKKNPTMLGGVETQEMG